MTALLHKKLEEQMAWLKKRGEAAKRSQRPAVNDEAAGETLPLLAIATQPQRLPGIRGLPNAILRSALFGAIRRGKRAFLQREKIASVDGVTVMQTGPRLDQADLDVWDGCLQLARTGGLGTWAQFSVYGFLKSMDRSTGGKDVEWLKGAFTRLSSTVVEVKDGQRSYFGPLIKQGARDDASGHYVVEINPSILSLFGADGWSAIELDQRRALKNQPLAQWLHGFYSSHAAPFPMRVETLHRLCGSENGSMRDFKRELKAALYKLEQATGWSWEITDASLVEVQKTPTVSQAKHLLRAQSKSN